MTVEIETVKKERRTAVIAIEVQAKAAAIQEKKEKWTKEVIRFVE